MAEWVPLAVFKNAQPNGYYVNSETVEGQFYQVGLFGEIWQCTCKAYLKQKLPCKHIARVLDDLQETEGGRDKGDTGSTVPDNPDAPALSRWLTKIHGKDFIQYEGLLAMAHEQGLCALGAAFMSVTTERALAFAWAQFKDGRRFWESGDATPTNVHAGVKAHYARVALTRAKARLLRDALNIGMVAVEELEG
jgi:hypothetical protein